MLLDKDAEVDTKNKVWGQTVLSWAAEDGHEAVVQLLLHKGAEVDTKDSSGWTPLSRAALSGHDNGGASFTQAWSFVGRRSLWLHSSIYTLITIQLAFHST